jgi:hypothetical protein
MTDLLWCHRQNVVILRSVAAEPGRVSKDAKPREENHAR